MSQGPDYPPPVPVRPLEYQSPRSWPYPAPYSGPAPDSNGRTMGMLCHLLAIFTGFLGPLIVWLVEREKSAFVNDQGKEALNFQITAMLIVLMSLPTCVVPLLGVLLIYLTVLTVGIGRVVFCIIATVKASDGVAFRYPICIRLVR